MVGWVFGEAAARPGFPPRADVPGSTAADTSDLQPSDYRTIGLFGATVQYSDTWQYAGG
jgi:hypothetical protein